jgi:GNAT superfamily N-acetyltransferase
MTTVRRATDGDLDILVEMGRAMHAESPAYRVTPYDECKVREVYQQLKGTLLTEAGCSFVAEEGGEIVGMAVAMASQHWFNRERMVTDLVVFVRPERRGGSAFRRLVRSLEQWTREQGITDLVVGISTGVHAERTAAAYAAMGFEPFSISLRKKHV